VGGGKALTGEFGLVESSVSQAFSEPSFCFEGYSLGYGLRLNL